MKKLAALMVALLVVGLSSTAFAQSDQKVESEFIEIDSGMDVFGTTKDPSGMRFTPPKTVEFDRLNRLKRSFLSKVQQSAEHRSLD